MAEAQRFVIRPALGEPREESFTKEDAKIIVVLESALLNLGRCLDLVKPVGLLVSSVPAATWSKALFNWRRA